MYSSNALRTLRAQLDVFGAEFPRLRDQLLHSAGEEWRKAVALGHLPAAMAAAAANRQPSLTRHNS